MRAVAVVAVGVFVAGVGLTSPFLVVAGAWGVAFLTVLRIVGDGARTD